MVAFSVARLTLASDTPSTLFTKRSMRLTHEAQVMPSIGRTTWPGVAATGAETGTDGVTGLERTV